MTDPTSDFSRRTRWANKNKLGTTPKCTKGSCNALEDLKPERAFVVYSSEDRYPMAEGIEAIGLREMAEVLGGRDG